MRILLNIVRTLAFVAIFLQIKEGIWATLITFVGLLVAIIMTLLEAKIV